METMEKKLYRIQFFGYYRDIYGSKAEAIKEAKFELSIMPFRNWVEAGYKIGIAGLNAESNA